MVDSTLTKHRYLAALKRFRTRIANGLELVVWDDTTVGSKDTENSWGLCSRTPESWPDKEDWIWPKRELIDGRVYGIKDPPYGCLCPFDRNDGAGGFKNESWGCFHRCMFFTPQGPKPDREEALRLYDIRIKDHEDA